MTSNEVLSMYENVAGLTNQMVQAARASDWESLGRLENQTAAVASNVTAGVIVPPQAGAERQRKIELLKQILANDRAIRDVTEPWLNQVPGVRQ
ncbi:flagellar protein FliT [Pseudoduganella namucuonensis]|uniref:Flagellar protein FliT n=1 Tax=Pseudoduganella namucuonensis TaxID=1035707 RepID=A0A1I7I6C8_9BURK|nr:flagellar protein FliT [Pseudoduganella namucuonensis]SFU68478.1 flagellar protein FliT [Pseudoduganella namucuonensis]